MNNPIDLKFLAPYLPYRLMGSCVWFDNNRRLRLVSEIDTYNVMNYVHGDTVYKPVLKPLTDLKSHFDAYRSDIFSDFEYYLTCIKNGDMDYSEYCYVFSGHYDAFDLIGKGLAINYNDIKNEI